MLGELRWCAPTHVPHLDWTAFFVSRLEQRIPREAYSGHDDVDFGAVEVPVCTRFCVLSRACRCLAFVRPSY